MSIVIKVISSDHLLIQFQNEMITLIKDVDNPENGWMMLRGKHALKPSHVGPGTLHWTEALRITCVMLETA